jgi:hypothetical protein
MRFSRCRANQLHDVVSLFRNRVNEAGTSLEGVVEIEDHPLQTHDTVDYCCTVANPAHHSIRIE